jgi:prevent-host-death family protein
VSPFIIEKSGLIWFDFSMKTMTFTESKTNLSALVEKVASTGQTIVIGRAGKPMVQLVPYHKPHEKPRIGGYKGKIKMDGSFDEWGEEDALALGVTDL